MLGVFDKLTVEEIKLLSTDLFKQCFLTLVADVFVNTPGDVPIGAIDILIKKLEYNLPGRYANEFVDVINEIKGEWKLLGEPVIMNKVDFVELCKRVKVKMEKGI